MNLAEPEPDNADEADLQDASRDGPRPENPPVTTVGTGSALGIGCVIAVIVFVLVAFSVRWVTGSW